MLTRPFTRPLTRGLTRPLLGQGGGIEPVVISAPDGAVTGNDLFVTGGCETRIYQLYINDVAIGDPFTVSPITLPSVAKGETLTVKDSCGNVSNSIVGQWDVDADSYITAGEVIDGEALEIEVARAMNDWLFVASKKTPAPIAATQWDAMLAGTAINLSGWRTIGAAIRPLKSTMPTPTNENFVQGDYHRSNGLTGNGIDKQLSGEGITLAQDDNHFCLWKSAIGSGLEGDFSIGSTNALRTDLTRNSSLVNKPGYGSSLTFIGAGREDSSKYTLRYGGDDMEIIEVSTNSGEGEYTVFNGFSLPSGSTLPFFSAGRAIDLAAMDASLTAYMAALSAALP